MENNMDSVSVKNEALEILRALIVNGFETTEKLREQIVSFYGDLVKDTETGLFSLAPYGYRGKFITMKQYCYLRECHSKNMKIAAVKSIMDEVGLSLQEAKILVELMFCWSLPHR
jgi:hypothetical protein